MAAAGQRPSIDIEAGRAALDEDIPRVLGMIGASTIEQLGWTRIDSLSILVPMRSLAGDDFRLRLGFHSYREWPPSAQFVNPATNAYVFPADAVHVPKLASNQVHTHTAYNHPSGGTIQLICCSATLEFYDVLHSVEPQHVWKSSNTFYTTIAAIQLAMTSAYHGRFGPNGQ